MVTLRIQKKEDGGKTLALSTELKKHVVDQQLPQEEQDILTVNCDAEEAGNCTTPTAKEYRIPDVLTCPPAPRKRKASVSVSNITFSNSKKSRKFYKFVVSSEIEAALGLHQVSRNNKIPWSCKKKFL